MWKFQQCLSVMLGLLFQHCIPSLPLCVYLLTPIVCTVRNNYRPTDNSYLVLYRHSDIYEVIKDGKLLPEWKPYKTEHK